jgi:hypothetical protein
MDTNIRRWKRATTFRRAGWLAVASMIGLALAGPSAGLALATTASHTILAGADVHKAFVCKYVGKPGVDESLQTGQNPIDVDFHAIAQDPVVVGSYFNDAQGRSFVLAIDTGQASPSVTDCPQPTPPPTDSTGSLTITKSVAGAGDWAGGIFTFSVTCTDPAFSQTGVTINTATSTTATVTGIPLNSDGNNSCTVVETGMAAVPAGHTAWVTTYSPEAGVSAVSQQTAGAVTVTNTTSTTPPNDRQFGSLLVTKTLAGDTTGFVAGDFTFSVMCDATSYGPVTINLASGSASATAITGIPAGAVCTVTETSRANPGTNWTWGAIPAAGTATIAANQQASVTITNTRTSNPPPPPPDDHFGSLTITKSVAGAPGGWTGIFTFSVACTAFSQTGITINTATGTTATVSGIPLSSSLTNSCTVAETGMADAPAGHAAWVTTYSPTGGVSAVSQQTAGAVTVTNTTSTNSGPKPPTGNVEGATGTPAPPPSHEVLSATGKPHVTPPPTDALGSTPGQPAGDTWRIALLGLAALLASLLVFSPRKTRLERRRR